MPLRAFGFLYESNKKGFWHGLAVVMPLRALGFLYGNKTGFIVQILSVVMPLRAFGFLYSKFYLKIANFGKISATC